MRFSLIFRERTYFLHAFSISCAKNKRVIHETNYCAKQVNNGLAGTHLFLARLFCDECVELAAAESKLKTQISLLLF
jgi:imidazoleglycerol phosphate synthase glutamine amidotransferase subunit HisH